MNSLLLVLITFVGYLIAYHSYGKYLARKVFILSDSNRMPSEELQDGIDFVPTKKNIVFGHHFTTIAGLGPIVGPAIGVIWGWLPALLWVFLGSVFMGAMHDFSTLIISARSKGKTIGDLTGDIIGPGARYALQFIMQILLFIVLSVFAMIVATLFVLYPESVIPVWTQIPIAIWLGYQIRKGRSDVFYSIVALILMYLSIYIGAKFPIDLGNLKVFQNMEMQGISTLNLITVCWSILLFIYVYIASTLPVQHLLQPRDYINSHQLLVAIFLIVLGVIIAHPVISAPAINQKAFSAGNDIPDMMPILFIIIACGAISGFHSIAGSGTTVKQIKKESETFFIGYGGMLTEGFLAVLVIVCVAAGLGMGWEKEGVNYFGKEAFFQFYGSWSAANSGIGAKLSSFIVGASNLLKAVGIPANLGGPMIAVFIVSFANTTLDSAARMQRLSLQELFRSKRTGEVVKPMNNRYIATFVVVSLAAIMTFLKPGGKGALMLWPLFGSLNQLLAALGLAVVSIWLMKKNKNYLLALLPMFFVLLMTVWSMVNNLNDFILKKDYLLIVLSTIVLGLAAWLLFTGARAVIWKSQLRT